MFSIKSATQKTSDALQRSIVKEWISAKLAGMVPAQLLKSAIIDAMEVECNEPDCAPLEVLVILGFPEFSVDGYRAVPHKWAGKILKPIREVSEVDVSILEIPIQCINDAFVKVHEALENAIETAIALERQNNDPTLVKELTNLLQGKLNKLISGSEQIELSVPSVQDGAMQQEEITPVFMASIANPNVITAPSTFTKVAQDSTSSTLRNDSSWSGDTAFNLPTNLKGSVTKASDYIVVSDRKATAPASRHEKGTRPRGCPCCDPDNLDNIIDKMLFMDMPPI
jgi:hypothetical protein